MDNNFTNINNTADEKKTLKDIQEILEKNKISADDIKKFTEYETIKTKKEDIENLLKKFENDFDENKITFKSIDEILTDIIEQLKDKRKKKRNKKTTKKTEEKVENTAEAIKTEETKNF